MISFYDVVVAGDELPGAVAGALLARRGYRVLLLSSAPVEADVIGGHPCPRAPLALVGLEGPTLKRVAADLNLVQQLRRRVTANHPAYQLCMPDHRIDVGEDLARELGRELPDEVARFEAWVAGAQPILGVLDAVLGQPVTLPPDGFWDRRDLKRIAAQLPRDDAAVLEPLAASPPLRALAAAPATFAADLDAPGAVATARLAELHRAGTACLTGGREALRALFHERVRAYAGEVRAEVVRGFVTRRGRIVGVGLGEHGETVGCELVIAAMPAARALELYPDEPPRRLREAAAVPAALHRYRLHVVAPIAALPDPLARLAFVVRDPAAPLVGANAFALHVAEPHGAATTLTLEALTADPTPPSLGTLRRALLDELFELIPFLDQHLELVWSAHEEGGAPLEPVWSFPSPPLGVCGLTYGAGGVKGLYLASRQVLPGLGLEGELAAGWGAARLVGLHHRRREVDKGALLAGSSST